MIKEIEKNVTPAYYFLAGNPIAEALHSQPYFMPSVDPLRVKKDFPILQQTIHGKPLIWLDNAATTQKPHCVIHALSTFYETTNSNVHRGAHTLAKKATEAYETAREKVQRFIGANSPDEIVFVRGATEGINLVAATYGQNTLKEGDEVLVTTMEHHSNIVPWQALQKAKGILLKPIPINEKGEVILEEFRKLFTSKTKLLAISHLSNVLGTINPIKEMIAIAHAHDVIVLVDGAQAAAHLPVNVQGLDADFYVFSGHKIYGPTGIGVLYGKKKHLDAMPPWQSGGGMIQSVRFDETTYHATPHKFEAGTGNIADAVGLGAAIDYLTQKGMEKIQSHEHALTRYAMEKLQKIQGIRMIGTSENKTGVLSFVHQQMAPSMIAQKLDEEGIAVRAGHHCAQPVLERLGVKEVVRASLGIYNTQEDLDALIKVVRNLVSHKA